MTSETQDILAFAAELLDEVRLHDPKRTPRSIAHAAYYSMFHAARAVLLEAHGTVSMKHGTVLNAFDALVRGQPIEDRRFSKILRSAYETRVGSDYTGEAVSAETAARLVALAAEFLTYCARRLGVDPPPTARP